MTRMVNIQLSLVYHFQARIIEMHNECIIPVLSVFCILFPIKTFFYTVTDLVGYSPPTNPHHHGSVELLAAPKMFSLEAH